MSQPRKKRKYGKKAVSELEQELERVKNENKNLNDRQQNFRQNFMMLSNHWVAHSKLYSIKIQLKIFKYFLLNL